MIEVQHLTKRYGSKLALDDLSFQVKEGEILGLLGPNGAGKSTTMNIVTGYLSATNGQVRIDGLDILEEPKKAKSKIGYLPEQPPLYPDMTVEEYLRFVWELKGAKGNREEKLGEICAQVMIDDVTGRLIKNLSKGYKQRVGLAQALVGDPSVLILDEPTVGLDPKQITEIRDLIRGLAKRHTVVFSSHILTEVQAVCDRIVVISGGKKVADDTPAGLAASMSAGRQLDLLAEGDPQQMVELLSAIDGMASVERLEEKEPGVFAYRLTPQDGCDLRREVFHALAGHGMAMLGLSRQNLSLEEIFLQLTDGEPHSQAEETQKGEEEAC